MPTYIDTLLMPFGLFFQGHERVYWPYLLIAFLVAALLYSISRRGESHVTIIEILNYIFPKKVYFHPSAVNDYIYFFTNTLLMISFVIPLFAFLSINVSILITSIATNFFKLGGAGSLLIENKIIMMLIITIVFALISDLAIFLSHYLQHHIPLLWEFHKVHHSALVLTPVTVYRMHPIDYILTFSMGGILFGLAHGLLEALLATDINIFNIAGVNLIFILFYLFAYNLRHSHIWFSYGPYLSYVFISPAQHQIHHSSDPKHYNKNMGFIFAFWDYFLNTLYVPKKKEILCFGINPNQDKKFLNFWSLYLMPIYNLFKYFKRTDLRNPKKYFSVLVFVSIVAPALYLSGPNTISQSTTKTLFIEDMTWQEIEQAIAENKTTILVPTGGTEQNGPHVILGKHNYIIKYTANEIAMKLNNALIAPVMTYVPEGNIDPPDGHMRFAGTLSITEQEFMAVLESTARSLKTHGFKVIAFIGDSGDSQTSQEKVAQKLDTLWRSQGIRVLHVGGYYNENKQVTSLLNRGFTAQQIGGHAGIRDTSELMEVHPEGVRNSLLLNHSNTNFTSLGADGDASKANKKLGRVLLDLKINTAVQQINDLLSSIDFNKATDN